MNDTMADRIRLIIDTDEQTRLAVRLAATAADCSTSELVNRVLREVLKTEMQDARKYLPKNKKDDKPKS